MDLNLFLELQYDSRQSGDHEFSLMGDSSFAGYLGEAVQSESRLKFRLLVRASMYKITTPSHRSSCYIN